MKYIADLHVHSHYAGATSRNICLETIYQWALFKGIDVVGTGDFTHPVWLKELKEKLQPVDNGFYCLKQTPTFTELPGVSPGYRKVYFCLSVEVSCEYAANGRKYRTHQLIYANNFDTVEKINKELSKYCDLLLDGRPSLKLQSHELFKIILDIPGAFFVPAHIWTPWCSSIGAMEGHHSLKECFKDVTKELFAVETSLSADPAMCYRYDELDHLTLLSNSDAHSAYNLGREVNLLDTELSYEAMFAAFKTKHGFSGTYEYYPQKGKCYSTGHRDCKVCLSVEDITDAVCRICGKPLTIGVAHRVEQLANRPKGQLNKSLQPFKHILPLPDILAEIYNIKSDAPAEKATIKKKYSKAISRFGNEFDILHTIPVEDISRFNQRLATAIERMRGDQMHFVAGYDGIYGSIHFFDEKELSGNKQMSLF